MKEGDRVLLFKKKRNVLSVFFFNLHYLRSEYFGPTLVSNMNRYPEEKREFFFFSLIFPRYVPNFAYQVLNALLLFFSVLARVRRKVRLTT